MRLNLVGLRDVFNKNIQITRNPEFHKTQVPSKSNALLSKFQRFTKFVGNKPMKTFLLGIHQNIFRQKLNYFYISQAAIRRSSFFE